MSTSRSKYLSLLLVTTALLVSACGQQEASNTSEGVEAVLVAEVGESIQAETMELSNGEKLYQENCAACHSNPELRAPSITALNAMSKEALLSAMIVGKMAQQTAHISGSDKQLIAEYLAPKDIANDSWETAMQCDSEIGFDVAEKVFVGGWGLGESNTRHQPSQLAGIAADDLSNLELVWSHAFPGVTEMRSQPVITSNTLFVGPSTSNKVYAFDLESGCVKWVYSGGAAIRSALAYGVIPKAETKESEKPFIYYGDVAGIVHAIDASNGQRLWVSNMGASEVDENADLTMGNNGNIIVTGTPVQHKNRVYIPGSSFEVSKASNPDYECCTKHGIVRAVDVRTGKEIWTYHTTEEAKPQGLSSNGTQLWGPSGAPVWTTPAIDEKRNVLYIGTGENYSQPTTKTSDAIIALNLDSGEPEWIFQATENDAYNLACSSWNGGKDGPNCPENPGPDFDFGASVIIAKSDEGEDILLAGQKSGDVWALDPDRDGAVIWNERLSGGTPVGGIHWGMTVVNDRVFVPIADPEWSISQWEYEPLAGMVALDVSSGKTLWRYESSRGCFINLEEIDMATGAPKVSWPSCPQYYGNSGAALGLDDAILAGTLNGKLQAFTPDTGSVIWEYDTKKPFQTLNGVEGHGGSLDNSGSIAVGNGYLVVQSGYSYINQMPGNVVLVLKATID